MGGCGIAIKKRCSPVVVLLVMEYSKGENVTDMVTGVGHPRTHERTDFVMTLT